MPLPTHDAVMEALDRVIDPELRRPVTDLGMVSSVDIAEDGVVSVEVLLTVAGCPLKDTITADTQREVGSVEGVTGVQVSLGVMNDEQKAELRRRLRGGAAEPVVPFTQPGNLTRVYAVTSGKGGVGKSSVTANLAAAMAAQGLSVGVVDADNKASLAFHEHLGFTICGVLPQVGRKFDRWLDTAVLVRLLDEPPTGAGERRPRS